MSDRKELIKELAKQSHESKDAELGSRKVEVRGKVVKLDSFRLPISDLRYNIRNGRFAAELKERERQEGRSLDPDSAKDAEIIKELLLDQEPEKTQSLKKDLKKHGQLEPGLITEDGYVINGNKRMAIFDDLQSETSESKWGYMEALILPKTVSAEDLWRIEAGYQLSDEKRIAYGPINELLKIREGTTIGLTQKQIADSIYGLKPSDVKERLEWLILVEAFLRYIKQPEEYKRIEGSFEHIKSLNQRLNTLKKEGRGTAEIQEFTAIEFEAIRHGATNTQVRQIGDAKTKGYKRAYSVLKKAYKKKELNKETVEDAVDFIKSERDTQKPNKLITKVVELLQMVNETDKNMLINSVAKEDLEEAKSLINKILYKYTDQNVSRAMGVDKLKKKFNRE